MGFDLEEYRQAHSLSYSKLADKLGLTWGRHAMRWALAESWPDADKLQRIFEATNGEVTLQSMYMRRLEFLASQNDPSAAAAFGITRLLQTPDQGRDRRRDGIRSGRSSSATNEEAAGNTGQALPLAGKPGRAA